MTKPFDLIEYAKDCIKSAGNPGGNDLITVTMPLERYKSVFEALTIAVEALEHISPVAKNPIWKEEDEPYSAKLAHKALAAIRSLPA